LLRIFGTSENEPLDTEASRTSFEKLTKEINNAPGHEKKMSVEEIAWGFIQIANEGEHRSISQPNAQTSLCWFLACCAAMCRPIRAITEAKGVSLPKHVLSCFGGAGGQHSCGSECSFLPCRGLPDLLGLAVARVLGIDTVLIHK
jgi:5-oxoprolinase (ATP-hydrolysing)